MMSIIFKLKTVFSLLVLLAFEIISAAPHSSASLIRDLSYQNNQITLNIQFPQLTQLLESGLISKSNSYAEDQSAEGFPAIGESVFRQFIVTNGKLPTSVRVTDHVVNVSPLNSLTLPTRINATVSRSRRTPFQKEQPLIEIQAPELPHDLVQIRRIGTLRGLTVFAVDFSLLQLDENNQNLLYYSALTIQITTIVSAVFQSPSLSPAFKRIVDQLTKDSRSLEKLNYRWIDQDHLLILAPPAFVTALEPLRQWKLQRGFDVTVTSLAEVGSTTEDIRVYIQNAYETWETPPSFVLLAGHPDLIPTFEGHRYPDTTAQFDYPTDLYYGTMDGAEDFLPELLIGRLPARTTSELTAMTQKIISYEQPENDTAQWLRHGSFVATGDPYFYDLVENTHRYAIDNYFYPQSLTSDSIWINSGGETVDIENSLNAGTNVLCYSGHGTEYIWQDPNMNPAVYFWSENIANLVNTSAFPLVLSFGCNAGIYGTAISSLGESWLLAENRGAVGFWGASNITFWYEDDYLERRFWDATFSGYLCSWGEMALYALLEVWGRGYPTGKYYLEIYNILGDPTLDFRFAPRDTVRGTLEGLVMNAVTLEPLREQALQITAIDDQLLPVITVMTDSLGQFHSPGPLVIGYYQIQSDRFGYYPFVDTVLLREGYNADTLLFIPRIPGALSGTVFAPGGTEPTDSVIVWIRGQSLRDTTGQDGTYNFESVMPDSVFIAATKRGFIWITDTLVLNDGEELTNWNYALTVGPTERIFAFEWDADDCNYSGDWEWGVPGKGLYLRGPDSAYAGNNVVATILDGDYSSASNSILTTPPLYLDHFTHATLAFYHTFQMDHINTGFDGGNVNISVDAGQTWEVIFPEEGYSVEALSGQNPFMAGQPAFSGSQPEWQLVQFNLDSYLESAEEIRFRFHFSSTERAEDVGWYLDQIALVNRQPQATQYDQPEIPTQVVLGQNYPNPFNRSTVIPFSIPAPGKVVLEIYDLGGRQIRSFEQSVTAPGEYRFRWDGKNKKGQPITSGLYLYRLRQNNQQQIKKLILLK